MQSGPELQIQKLAFRLEEKHILALSAGHIRFAFDLGQNLLLLTNARLNESRMQTLFGSNLTQAALVDELQALKGPDVKREFVMSAKPSEISTWHSENLAAMGMRSLNVDQRGADLRLSLNWATSNGLLNGARSGRFGAIERDNLEFVPFARLPTWPENDCLFPYIFYEYSSEGKSARMLRYSLDSHHNQASLIVTSECQLCGSRPSQQGMQNTEQIIGHFQFRGDKLIITNRTPDVADNAPLVKLRALASAAFASAYPGKIISFENVVEDPLQ